MSILSALCFAHESQYNVVRSALLVSCCLKRSDWVKTAAGVEQKLHGGIEPRGGDKSRGGSNNRDGRYTSTSLWQILRFGGKFMMSFELVVSSRRLLHFVSKFAWSFCFCGMFMLTFAL